MRIVTFLPTGTEILLALGAGDMIVGVSHENLAIERVAHLPMVSGLTYDESNLTGAEVDRLVSETYAKGGSIYRIDEDLVRQLQPDLLITQEVCDVCAITPNDFQKMLMRLDPVPEVLSLNAHTLEEAQQDVQRVAKLIGQPEAGERLVAEWRRRTEAITARSRTAQRRPRVFCLEWPEPLYNSGHWAPEMVEVAGGEEVLGRAGEYSTRIAWEQLREADPETIIAMICGFSRERACRELEALRRYPGYEELQAVRNGQVWVVDGPRHFSQAGPGLLEGMAILARILHPEIFGAPALEQAIRF